MDLVAATFFFSTVLLVLSFETERDSFAGDADFLLVEDVEACFFVGVLDERLVGDLDLP